jgi:hypothetical protein
MRLGTCRGSGATCIAQTTGHFSARATQTTTGALTIFLKTGGFPLGHIRGTQGRRLIYVPCACVAIAAKRDRP